MLQFTELTRKVAADAVLLAANAVSAADGAARSKAKDEARLWSEEHDWKRTL